MSDRPISRQGRRLQREAETRALELAGVFAELSELTANAAAEELNSRGIKATSGGKWHATQVIRVRKRLRGRPVTQPVSFEKGGENEQT
jgi:hypothetical protein